MTDPVTADRRLSPPDLRAEVIGLACEPPADSQVPLARWSSTELAREAVSRGICEQISGVTVWRWLSEDAIKPWLDVARVDEQTVEVVFQDRPVGSGRGAVLAFPPARFLGPPSEPDVRVSTHPALHEPMPSNHAVAPVVVAVCQGVGMLVPR
jgi:hypothetical protein